MGAFEEKLERARQSIKELGEMIDKDKLNNIVSLPNATHTYLDVNNEAFARPSTQLRFKAGVLQQLWYIQSQGGLESEWRDVPHE